MICKDKNTQYRMCLNCGHGIEHMQNKYCGHCISDHTKNGCKNESNNNI